MMQLFTGSGVGPTVLYLALSIFIGLLLGKIKIAKISLGITWVLFVGIAFSACGISLNPEMLHVIKEFGLILFVVAVGLQVGPGFFRSFKKGGLAMNLMALVNVALGVLITVIIAKVAHQDLADMAGVYTGAITNTPGLSAAQQAVTDLGIEGAADRLAAGYAVAYPLAVVGMIVTCILLRPLCRIDLAKEPVTLETKAAETASGKKGKGGFLLIPVFVIIALGIILGSIPIPAIIGGWLGVKKGWFSTEFTEGQGVHALREVGIALFLAGVGLSAGGQFVATVQEHYMWVVYGVIITMVPPILVTLFGRLVLKMNYYTAYLGHALRSFGTENELLHVDGLHRWQPHRPSHPRLCQHRGARGLQTAQHGLCHRVSIDHVFEDFHCSAVGVAGGVKTKESRQTELLV